jgi:hypothetical protein
VSVSLDCPLYDYGPSVLGNIQTCKSEGENNPPRVDKSVIYGNLENKINTLYWPVENSIPKNNDRSRL